MANEDDLNRAWDGDKKLQNADLNHADLREIDLSGVNLEGATLERANLQEANLEKANLDVVNLVGANLQEANLEGANLEGANLQRTNLRGANLQGVNLCGANLQRVILERANLQGANLQETSLQEARLEEAILQRTNLEGANLEGANLYGASLYGANLQEANLKTANLQRTRLETANLLDVNLEGVNLTGVDLRQVKNLTCRQLRRAPNWLDSFRDEELACGASIPTPPNDTTRKIQENDPLWTFFGDLKGLREDEKYLYIVNKEGIERKISTEKYATSYIKNLKAKINTLTGDPVDFQTATNWSEETWFNDIRKSKYSTPETPSQPNEMGSATSHVTTLIQQRELTHWTAQSLADVLAEFTKHQDNQLSGEEKEFFQTLGNTLHEIAQQTVDENANKDDQIAALQKQVADLKAQLTNSSSFWKKYKIKAAESLGDATGPIVRDALRVSMGVGLFYLGGSAVTTIATTLLLKP